MAILPSMNWRSVTPYNCDDDVVFPSIAKNGLQAIQPDMLLKRHIRQALAELGIAKRIGWHSYQHGLAVMLRQYGVDIKTAQELLRHANSEQKRAAQGLAVRGLSGKGAVQHP